MRASALFGGVTKRGSTRSVRVGNSFGSTVSVSTCAISLPAAVRAVMATGTSPGRDVQIDPHERSPHAVVIAERLYRVSEVRDRDRAQRLAGAHVETHDLAGLHGPRVRRDLNRIGLNESAPRRQGEENGAEPPAKRHGT